MKMEFKQMHKILPEQETKNFKIVHHTATKKDVKGMKIRDILNKTNEFEDFKEGVYLELRINSKSNELPSMFGNNIIMSDTPMELKTNLDAIYNSHGKVLIGGLGIGAILLLIQSKKEVDSILIIEKYQEIIDLIKPHLPLNNKVKIICSDINDFIPTEEFNTIYFDIWNDVCGDNYEVMKKLKSKFRKFFDKNDSSRWIGCWREKDCRRLAKENDY